MAYLAIKGHATRGKEIIKILKMLGGKTRYGNFEAHELSCGYYINVVGYIGFKHYSLFDDTTIFTLEEFLEKFPYKVGDKVQHKGATSCGSVFEVENMRWEEDTVKYTLCLFGCNYKRSTLPAEYLKPYKEVPIYLNEKANKQAEKIEKLLEPVKEIMEEIKLEIPDGYEFFGIGDDNKIVLTKKQPQYPKTYEECCNILDVEPYSRSAGYKSDLITAFRNLLICRDAYWKIAGDWKPDWNAEWDPTEYKHIIYTLRDKIALGNGQAINSVLAFPNAEMRDIFYENFKELIELCKELL